MIDERFWTLQENPRIPPEQRLAIAVVLVGMEDFIKVMRKPKRFWKKEDYLDAEWPYSESAEFWCEAAGICIKKLRKWADATKEQIQKRKTLSGFQMKGGIVYGHMS